MKKSSDLNKERPATIAGLSLFQFWNLLVLIGLIVLPLWFLLLPVDYFSDKQSLCLSIVLFDLECYGCGMMRAIKALVSLDVSHAFQLNRLSILVFPLLGYYWITRLLNAYKSIRK
jgi:hypothetical protein